MVVRLIVARPVSLFMMRGYTLLELLIVIVLIGLISGLTLPRLSRLYESAMTALERDLVLRQIAGLGYRAYRAGKTIELVSYPLPEGKHLPLELPEGWVLTAESPIRYHYNGVCDGGMLILGRGEQKSRWRLLPPLCHPEPM